MANNTTEKEILLRVSETGEVLSEVIINKTDSIIIQDSELKQKRKEYPTNSNNKKSFTNSLGGFIWVLYYNNQKLFHDLPLQKATISRLIMLATYIKFDDNALINDDRQKQNKEVNYMTKKDIQTTLKLAYTQFNKFYNEVVGMGILYEQNGIYYLNKDLFYKGESKGISNKTNYTKLYIKTARQIYNSSTTTQHKFISYVFELMPQIHYKSNFIVFDNVTRDDDIKYMDLYDICNYLGLSTERRNVNRFKKDMLSLRIEHNNNQYYLFNVVTFENESDKRQRFAINPLLFNSMSSDNEIKKLISSLFIGDVKR